MLNGGVVLGAARITPFPNGRVQQERTEKLGYADELLGDGGLSAGTVIVVKGDGTDASLCERPPQPEATAASTPTNITISTSRRRPLRYTSPRFTCAKTRVGRRSSKTVKHGRERRQISKQRPTRPERFRSRTQLSRSGGSATCS
jgi:hypothetical protein